MQIPRLKILKLSNCKATPTRHPFAYQVKNIHISKGKFHLNLDWVYLENPLLKIEIKGFAKKTIPLQPKIVYGKPTQFFSLQLDCFIWELFPELIHQKIESKKIAMFLSIQGKSTLPPQNNIEKTILQLRISPSKIYSHIPEPWHSKFFFCKKILLTAKNLKKAFGCFFC